MKGSGKQAYHTSVISRRSAGVARESCRLGMCVIFVGRFDAMFLDRTALGEEGKIGS